MVDTIRFNPISGFLTGDPVVSDKIQKDIAGMRDDISGIKQMLDKRNRRTGNMSSGQLGDNSPTSDTTITPEITARQDRPKRGATNANQERGANGKFVSKNSANPATPAEPKSKEPEEKKDDEEKKDGWFSKLVAGISRLKENITGSNVHGIDPMIDAAQELTGLASTTKKGLDLAFKTIAAPFKGIAATYRFFKPNSNAGGSRATLMFRGWRKRAQDRQQRTLDKIVNVLKAVGFGGGGGTGEGLAGGLLDNFGAGRRRRGGRLGRLGSRTRGLRGLLGRVGRFGRGRGGLIGAALGAFSLADIMTDDSMTGSQKVHATGNLAGSVVGGIGGAALGAAVGTAIFPVVGTVIGGLIGGWLGSKGGEVVADKAQDALAKVDISGIAANSLKGIAGVATGFYQMVVDTTSKAFESIADSFNKGINKGAGVYNGAVNATSNAMSYVSDQSTTAKNYLTGSPSTSTQLTGAGGRIGAGDLHNRAVSTALAYSAGNIGNLSDRDTRQLVASTVATESSGGDISAKNRFGYFGRYQTGAAYLANAGLIKGGKDAVLAAKAADGFAGKSDWAWGASGGQTRFLQNDANWNNGLSLDKYRADSKLQDSVFQTGQTAAYNQMLKDGTITPNTPPAVVRGLLKAAHIAGIGGAHAVAAGRTGASDANGTSALDYYNQGSSNAYADIGAPVASTPKMLSPSAASAATVAPTATIGSITDPTMSYFPSPAVTVDVPRIPIASVPPSNNRGGTGKPDQQVSNPRLAQIATGGISSNAKLN